MRWRAPAWIVLAAACARAPVDPVDTDVVAVDDPADTDDTDPGVVPPTATLIAGEPVACADPAARDVARFDLRELAREPVKDDLFRLFGGGAVIADLDGDGALDVFTPGRDRHQLWVRGPDGGVVDTWPARVAPDVDLSYATGASAADHDGDGDLDLLVTRWDLAPVLLRQDDGVFVDATAEAGIGTVARATGSTWGDLDGDGDLDLFVGTYGPHPAEPKATDDFEVADRKGLWENRGDGTFVDRADMLSDDVHASYTFTGAWQDLDGDLRPELLMIDDFGWARPDRLLWNQGGTLVEDDGGAGIAQSFAGMGLGLGDLNGDGIADLVQSSWKDTSLLLSAGPRTWVESSRALGLRPVWDWDPAAGEQPEGWVDPNQVFGWGTELVDLDLDGDEDAVMNFGFWDEYGNERRQRDAVFERDADGTFHDRAAAWGFDHPGASRGLAVGDLNGDGFPDLVVRVLDAPTRVHVSRCGDAAWLRVRLRAPAPNTGAIGARVRVVVDGRAQVRWIRAGGTGMFGASAPEAHFGLADADAVDQLEVTWPDGAVSTFADVGARRVVDVVRTR